MKNKDGRNADNSAIEMMSKLISEPYYLLHFLIFFSYIPVRFAASQFLSPHFISHLLHREIQAILAFSVLTVVKIVKEETWEGFVADTLFFAKVFLAAIALVLDYHLALWFTLAFLVIYVFTQQPAYEGLGTTKQLTPLQFEALLTEGSTSRYWLVELRNSSSSTCIRTSQIFPDLSITFSNKHLSFGIIDLGLFPNTSEKFGISLGRTEQLPTYILFDNAEEVTRFPELDFESKIFNPSITKLFYRIDTKKTWSCMEYGMLSFFHHQFLAAKVFQCWVWIFSSRGCFLRMVNRFLTGEVCYGVRGVEGLIQSV